MISRRLLRIKVIKAMYAHISGQADSASASQKSLVFTINKTYELYFLMLRLPVDVARYAAQVAEDGKNRFQPTAEELNPKMRFIENPVIAQLDQSNAINRFLERNTLSWVQYPELIKHIYQNLIQKEYYQEYLSKESCNYNAHKEFVKKFYANEIEDCQKLYEVIEEMSIYWMDDIEYAASHAMATITTMKASNVTSDNYEEIKLLPLFKDPDDAQYAKDLFIKSVTSRTENMQYIDKFTHNWDVERIAFMDKIVMLVAITEIKEFPAIPLNVSMDEYIEIAKYYSTNNSSNFVNGVLDRIIADLNAQGLNKKYVSNK